MWNWDCKLTVHEYVWLENFKCLVPHFLQFLGVPLDFIRYWFLGFFLHVVCHCHKWSVMSYFVNLFCLGWNLVLVNRTRQRWRWNQWRKDFLVKFWLVMVERIFLLARYSHHCINLKEVAISCNALCSCIYAYLLTILNLNIWWISWINYCLMFKFTEIITLWSRVLCMTCRSSNMCTACIIILSSIGDHFRELIAYVNMYILSVLWKSSQRVGI